MANFEILIVDDQPLVLTAIARFLEQRGYTVHTAGNGEEGLRAAAEHSPDLIITDVRMPVMDGWTLVKHLRSQAEFALLPVIILTDLDSAENRMQGFRLGADDFVSKGTIVEELEVRVARALERTEAIRRALGVTAPPTTSPSEDSGIFKRATQDDASTSPTLKPAVPEMPFHLPPLAGKAGQGAARTGPEPDRDPASEPAAAPAGTPGMTGTLDQIGLASILTLLSSGGKSGILNIIRVDGADRGQIFLRDGTVLRVRVEGTPELRHADGVAELMSWSGAQFAFSLQDVTAQDEISIPTEHLLMEASRLMDEGGE